VSGHPEAFVSDSNDKIGVAQPMVYSQKPIYLPRYVLSVKRRKYITYCLSVELIQRIVFVSGLGLTILEYD